MAQEDNLAHSKPTSYSVRFQEQMVFPVSREQRGAAPAHHQWLDSLPLTLINSTLASVKDT